MSNESKISKAQQKAVNKYVKNNYDRINVTLPKGQKAVIEMGAEATNNSVNSYIRSAIEKKLEQDKDIIDKYISENPK